MLQRLGSTRRPSGILVILRDSGHPSGYRSSFGIAVKPSPVAARCRYCGCSLFQGASGRELSPGVLRQWFCPAGTLGSVWRPCDMAVTAGEQGVLSVSSGWRPRMLVNMLQWQDEFLTGENYLTSKQPWCRGWERLPKALTVYNGLALST